MPVLAFPRYSKVNQYIRSRIGDLQIDEERVGEILREYDLELIRKPSNLPYGRRGNNILVPTSGGKKVIRRYRKKWKSSTIYYEHSILSELEENNFLAPRLNITGDQRSLVTIHGENYALFDFIKGRNLSMSYMIPAQRDSLVDTAAINLGELHSCLQGFEPEGQHHLGFLSLRGRRTRDMEWNRSKLAQLVQDSLNNVDAKDSEILQHLVGISETVISNLADLDDNLHSKQLPRTVIHGDYGLHNVLFNDSWEAIPMDFELARLEWRLSDFSISFRRLRDKKGQYDLAMMKRFLGAYQLKNPVSVDEWKLFPEVWQHTLLYSFVQYWKSYFDTNRNSARLDLALDAFNQYLWVKDNSDLLIDLTPLL